MSYKSVWDFGRGGAANYGVHKIGEYPSKIRPLVFGKVIERFSKAGDVVLDPFCGCGTMAVEAKLQGRSSVNYDVNAKAVALTKKKLKALTPAEMKKMTRALLRSADNDPQSVLGSAPSGRLTKFQKIQLEKEKKKLSKWVLAIDKKLHSFLDTSHLVKKVDSRKLPLKDESVDAVITDIPYASMIPYSKQKDDLSTMEDYGSFVKEIGKSFAEIMRVLKNGKYCAVFCADYRIGAARQILPLHSDVTHAFQGLGMRLFDTYILRYYRSGGFRPFGAPPYQAMNVHLYVLVFYKPKPGEKKGKKNRPVRYRKRLKEKLKENA